MSTRIATALDGATLSAARLGTLIHATCRRGRQAGDRPGDGAPGSPVNQAPQLSSIAFPPSTAKGAFH